MHSYSRRIQTQQEEVIPWGINAVDVNSLWTIPPQKHVKICVIDTGYDLGHPDLPTNSVSGWVPSDASVCGTPLEYGNWFVDEDKASHGTHISGIIGAIGSNGSELNQYFMSGRNPYLHPLIFNDTCFRI
jgi:serine protease